MNRVIKFRAWDASEKEMVCWPSLYNDPDDWFISLLEGDEPDDVLMQFTGLTDKHGEEIYEGDIIQRKSERETVKQRQLTGLSPFTYCAFGHTFTNPSGCWLPEECEVIGNIYQNPELCS